MNEVFNPATFVVRPLLRATHLERHPVYTDVRWARGEPAAQGPCPAVRQKNGVKYERRVCDVLAAIYAERFTRSPAILYRFAGEARPRRAILDGLLELDDSLVIVEVKLTHTAEVWNQLMLRYRALVAALAAPRLLLRTVEVCRTYDPAVNVRHTLIESLHKPPAAPGGLEVLQWKI